MQLFLFLQDPFPTLSISSYDVLSVWLSVSRQGSSHLSLYTPLCFSIWSRRLSGSYVLLLSMLFFYLFVLKEFRIFFLSKYFLFEWLPMHIVLIILLNIGHHVFCGYFFFTRAFVVTSAIAIATIVFLISFVLSLLIFNSFMSKLQGVFSGLYYSKFYSGCDLL